MTRLLVVLFASLVAASCGAVRTNIAVTHAFPPAGSAKTVAILPYTNTLGARADFQSPLHGIGDLPFEEQAGHERGFDFADARENHRIE